MFDTLSQKITDLLYRGQNSSFVTETANKFVIIGIDDQSLQEYGRISSWPRTLHAKLIDTLNENGARIIAFDILFSEASSDDAILAAAIKRAGNVVLPYASTTENVQTEDKVIVRPLEAFEGGALDTGHGNMSPDADGVIRKIPVFLSGDQPEPSLSLVTVSRYLRRTEVYDSITNKGNVVVAGREIPLQHGGMLINYTNTPSTNNFQTVSYSDVLNGRYPPGIFNDKIVIIGVTALGYGDVYWTPLGQPMPGVEIHAQAMNTILSGQFIKPVSSLTTDLLVIIFSLVVGLITLRLRVLWSAVSTLLIAAGYCLAAIYLMDRGLLADLFHPLMTIAAVSLGVNFYNVTVARVEKGEITRTFGKYVSPPVASKILNTINEGSLKLGGEECPVTVLFADVRGFTGICEKLGPDIVVKTLNRYFSIIIESILQYDGIVSKFGGDNIMAVWNAPIKCPDHALRAVQAAITAQERIGTLPKGTPDIPEMKFGIGINTGKAIVGNMGSIDRLEYSLIGDDVNVAARLSSAVPGEKIWIGPETYESTKNQYKVISLGPLAMKGKTQLVNIYELLPNINPISDPMPSENKELIKAAF